MTNRHVIEVENILISHCPVPPGKYIQLLRYGIRDDDVFDISDKWNDTIYKFEHIGPCTVGIYYGPSEVWIVGSADKHFVIKFKARSKF